MGGGLSFLSHQLYQYAGILTGCPRSICPTTLFPLSSRLAWTPRSCAHARTARILGAIPMSQRVTG